MSKRINVNPDHYKTAGRQRPGDQVVQELYKQRFRRSRAGKSEVKALPGDTRRRKKAQPSRKRV